MNAQLGPIFYNYFKIEVKNTYKSKTMILLLILFYYIISENLSFLT